MSKEKIVKDGNGGGEGNAIDKLISARMQKVKDDARKEVEPYAAVVAYEMQERGVVGYENVDIQKMIYELAQLEREYTEIQEKYQTDKFPHTGDSWGYSKFAGGVTRVFRDGKPISVTQKGGEGRPDKTFEFPEDKILCVLRDNGISYDGASVELARIKSVLNRREAVLQILKEFDVYSEGLFLEREAKLMGEYKKLHTEWKSEDDKKRAPYDTKLELELGMAKWSRLQALNAELAATGGKELKKLPKPLDTLIENSVRASITPYVKNEGEPERPNYDARGKARSASFVRHINNPASDNYELWEKLREMQGVESK